MTLLNALPGNIAVTGNIPHHFVAPDGGCAQIWEKNQRGPCVRTATRHAKRAKEAVTQGVHRVIPLARTRICVLMPGGVHGRHAKHATSAPKRSIVLRISNATKASV